MSLFSSAPRLSFEEESDFDMTLDIPSSSANSTKMWTYFAHPEHFCACASNALNTKGWNPHDRYENIFSYEEWNVDEKFILFGMSDSEGAPPAELRKTIVRTIPEQHACQHHLLNKRNNNAAPASITIMIQISNMPRVIIREEPSTTTSEIHPVVEDDDDESSIGEWQNTSKREPLNGR